MKKRLLIGVIMTECHADFQDEIMRGIISQAFKADCDIAVLAPLNNFFSQISHKQTEKNIFELIKSERFDGFLYDRQVFYSDDVKNHIAELLVQSGRPVMLLDSEDHRLFEATAIDDCSAFEEITDHLIDVHNCKKILCLTGPKKTFVAEERLKGFRNSMKKHGLSCERSDCIYGDFWKNAAQKLASEILSGSMGMPDAVVCGNDHSAMALAEALIRGGIKVPEDIRITGYDDTVEGRQFSPAITTYRRPNFQLGAEAFRRLYRIITGRICVRVHNETGCFQPRYSCGCSKSPRPDRTALRRDKINSGYKSDIMYRDMLWDISNTSSPDEFSDRLDNYTYYIYKMRNMYICLTRKYIECPEKPLSERLTFSIRDEMKIILGKSAVKRSYDEKEYFKASDILPVFGQERPYPVAYYISPLVFNENFFGYSAVSFGKIPMSFSEIYTYWIKYVNTALEQVRIRSMLSHTISTAGRAMIHDETTGLPNRSGVKKAFAEKLGSFCQESSSAGFIRIQLSGLNEQQYQDDDEKCCMITAAFADILRRLVKEYEILGLWSIYSFAVITVLPDRGRELFERLSDEAGKSQFFENPCNISFTIGVYSQPLYPEPSLDTALHKAALNRIYSYTVSQDTVNPRYEKLCRLRSRIMKNPEFSWNISDIARELYLSKSYLQKIYKTYFGRSIIEEMIQFRIEKAKELLASTDMTVTEISHECGYSSYNYFVRQFKNSEGISPSEFRNYSDFTSV